MIRIIIISVITLTLLFLILEGTIRNSSLEKPIFLRSDEISNAHHTKISINSHSLYQPSVNEMEILKKDYSNIWAHLNYLYGTNDVEAGKEYYTESWFNQICKQYNGNFIKAASRRDLSHDLHIQNWSSDGLICTAIDKNVEFVYQFKDHREISTKANIAIVLLLQGDHWRIDAIRIINETNNQ